MKITISKSQWESMGKKAGWMKTALIQYSKEGQCPKCKGEAKFEAENWIITCKCPKCGDFKVSNNETKSTSKYQMEKEKSISYHITGNFPVRQADEEDRKMSHKIVYIPVGFEPLMIAVYGEGLDADDCIEAAFEYLKKINPNWTKDWDNIKETAYVGK